MKLVIAEKEVLGKSIADAIPGASVSENGAIKKGDYVITWASGHLLELKEPHDYDSTLAKWNLDALPIYFDNWGKKVKKDNKNPKEESASARRKLDIIGRYIHDADTVIHAGDPDDEGQYLIDELIDYFDYRGPVMRLATRDTSAPALKKALNSMDDNRTHLNAGQSAYARSVADMMVGVNLTRFFTIKNPPALLSIGRVQTPTLGLVVRRDMQIEGHQKQKYYTISADVDVDGTGITARYNPKKDDERLIEGRIIDRSVAAEIEGMVKDYGSHPQPCEVKKKIEDEQPPLPFNLVELQSYCEKNFKYTPDQTLNITQSLRDNYNAISYNRTNCQYLSSNQFDEAPLVMDCVVQNIKYKPSGMDMTIKSRAFDDAYLDKSEGTIAHLAIIPQQVTFDMSKLSGPEKNVYLAICKFYMAQFMPPAKKEITSFVMNLPDGGTLKASSTVILEQGYRTIFKDAEKEDSSDLSTIPQGKYSGLVTGTKVEENETKPPARYTQASLGKDMTRIARFVDDPEIKRILLEKDKGKREENGSIGTEATRAGIIKHLLDRGYLESDDKGKIKSTPLGRELFRILPDQLKNPDMTALWWSIQEDIKKGNATVDTLTGNVLEMINEVLQTEYPRVDMNIIPDKYKRKGGSSREVLGTCPRCGKPVIEGKTGFGCSGWKDGCKFVIWKKSKSPLLKNETITATDAKNLLAGKRIHKKHLYSSKKDKEFESYLYMEDDPSSQYGPSLKLDFDYKPAGGKKKGYKK